jgi:hypothetical protein
VQVQHARAMAAAAAAVAAMTVVGCASRIPGVALREPTEPIHYDVRLVDVSRTSASAQCYGPVRLARQDSAGAAWYAFEDSLVSVVVAARDAGFRLSLQNRSAQPIRVLWDAAAYVDADGAPHAVRRAPGGISTAVGAELPSVLGGGGRIDEVVVLARNASAPAAGEDADAPHPLMSAADVRSGARDSAAAALAALKGKRVQLVLPLEVKGALSRYTLNFVLADVRIGAWMSVPDTVALTTSTDTRGHD